MNYALILVPLFTLLLGGTGGYYIGRYHVALLDKIRTLQGQARAEQAPTVTMGEYSPPHDINETDMPIGLVEAKTPQRVEWEAEQAIEKEGLGR
jgi:hypothetical protein